MPAVAPDDKKKIKTKAERMQEAAEPKHEISDESRRLIMQKVGKGFNKVDIHPIIPDQKYRVNCWKSDGEGMVTQWKIEKSLWVVFENGAIVA